MEKERHINTDKYGNALLSVKDGKEALLRGMNIDFAIFDDLREVDVYNQYSEQVLGHKAVIRHPENQDLDIHVYPNLGFRGDVLPPYAPILARYIGCKRQPRASRQIWRSQYSYLSIKLLYHL